MRQSQLLLSHVDGVVLYLGGLNLTRKHVHINKKSPLHPNPDFFTPHGVKQCGVR